MSRDLRTCIPDVDYHLYSRCINRENLMKDDRNKELMITVLKETQKMYIFHLSGFEILDNHFHFFLKPLSGGESLSKIMQRVKSVFARRYNKIHGRTGPFWNERFKSKIIQEAKDATNYALHLLWYMAYNSYRKKQVHNPRDYRYGSINCYLDKNYRCKLKITLHDAFINLGKTFEQRVKAFLLYEEQYLNSLRCQRC